jgi:peptide/nickel transport system permease protein
VSARYVVRRLGSAVGQLFILTLLVFVGTASLSGDAAVALLGADYDPDRAARLRARLNLDDPLWVRFGRWLAGVCRGDLGRSLVGGAPVSDLIATSTVPTVILTVATLFTAVPLAVLLGLTAGARADGALDRVLTSISLALYAVPDFVLALLLVAVVSHQLHLVPPTALGAGGTTLLTRPALLVLPVVVLC